VNGKVGEFWKEMIVVYFRFFYYLRPNLSAGAVEMESPNLRRTEVFVQNFSKSRKYPMS
jgi:hypothetical protein